ncbi:VanZ family protein [Pelosinus baikalensis]|uniref:VanZ family protein n=1 Tax=Pelosinus baikalensis TaxID=2892015 RepID=A0ABS8HMH9_9FIRM|nr:VanZ family protein [Pelosinus baikalensis]MCC5464142.1 VanZ family protein [Pelosinus baikalensis]
MKNIWRWLSVLIIMIIIYFLSDIPNLHLISEAQIPLWLRRFVSQYYIKIGSQGYFSYMFSLHPDFILHKIGHIVAFGTLGISIYWATRYSAVWAIILTAIAAAFDEWHQYFIPGRCSRFGDVVLDTLAATIFILLVKSMKQKSKI